MQESTDRHIYTHTLIHTLAHNACSPDELSINQLTGTVKDEESVLYSVKRGVCSWACVYIIEIESVYVCVHVFFSVCVNAKLQQDTVTRHQV